MRQPARLIAVLAALLLAPLLLAGQVAAQTFPKFTGLVVDAANILPQATRDDLTRKLEALQKDTHRQLVVATIPDLQGYPIEDYGYKLGREWGVGLRDVNNGVILFVAPNEPSGHKGPRIEVGYGLEPIITDALGYDIVNNLMTPMLKAGDVSGAMEAGTDAIIKQLRASPDEAKARTAAAAKAFDTAHRRGAPGGFPWGLAFWGMILVFVVLSSLRRRHGARYGGSAWPIFFWGGGGGWGDGGGSGWGGGSSSGGGDGSWGGGGFTGGGGGSFGGGGATGGW